MLDSEFVVADGMAVDLDNSIDSDCAELLPENSLDIETPTSDSSE